MDIFVHYMEGLSIYDIKNAKPEGYIFNREQNQLEWHFKNLEPTAAHMIEVSHTDPTNLNSWIAFSDCSDGDASSFLPPENDEELRYYPCQARDFDTSTAWVEGVEGSGIGEWIAMSMPFGKKKVYEKISIVNGYARDTDIWQKNNRIKKAKLTFDTGEKFTLDFADTRDEQIINLPEKVIGPASSRLEILEVYPGTKFDDTCLSEVRLLGLLAEGTKDVKLFSDVSLSHKYAQAIKLVKQKGILEGYPDGSYKPDQQINRAEFTKIILEAIDIVNQNKEGHVSPIEGDSCFPDVASEWFAKYICGAKQNNIIAGYPDGTFKPGNTVNLAEALKIISESKVRLTDGNYYMPDTSQEPWHKGYFDFAEMFNIFETIENNPGHLLTRGEMAEIIYKMLLE